MLPKTFFFVSGVIFAVVALLHVVRLVAGWEGMIAGVTIPMWASGIAVVVASYLAYEGFRLRSRSL